MIMELAEAANCNCKPKVGAGSWRGGWDLRRLSLDVPLQCGVGTVYLGLAVD